MVACALERGHQVTLFNRGIHGADLFPEARRIKGDRDGGLEALGSEEWDAVVDPSGYLPRVVSYSGSLLRRKTNHYTFISSISVYADPPFENMDENAPIAKMADPTVERIDGETYGPLKALCEQAIQDIYHENALVIRPGLIVGPNDPTDRFTYWPVRVGRGGEVAAPGDPFAPVQFIDVRDLAEWAIKMVEGRVGGTFNATGPGERLSMSEFLNKCKSATQSSADFTWMSEEFLLEQKVAPFIEMPLWVPADQKGIHEVSIRRAVENGLAFRPMEETIRDTYLWDKTRPAGERRAGLKKLQEEDLLRKWKATTRFC